MNPLFASLRFEGVAHPWLWLLLLAAGAAFVAWTYHEIAQRADRRLSLGLMALRAAGLLALVLALAKPTWTRESDLVDPGRLAVVLDNSASMSLADPSGKPRFALAQEAVERLRTALGSNTAIDLFDVAGEPVADVRTLKPTIERTDLARAVSEAVTRLRSRPLAGVVLISDGMDNTGSPDLRELADAPVPVHTVGFRADPDAGTLDLAVRNVRAPVRTMVHNQVKVDVTLSKTGGPATEAEVVLKRGHDAFANQKVTLPAGNVEQTVSLNLTPSQAGAFVFTASVAGATGERLLANNAAHFPLRVDTEPIRVLYLEGFLRYEYKFLKNRLEDDPDVSLVSVVRRANPERPEAKSDDGLLGPDRLKNFDVVILGDMEASYISAPEYQALLEWLDEKDHALLVLGGYRSFGPEGFRTTPLAEALPVVFAETSSQSEEPFTLQLTEEGRRHPVFEITGDRAQDASAWAAAPPLLGTCLVQGAKPGAEVLAVHPDLQVAGKPAVVAAVQRFGAGHTMVLAADTTWRWSRLARVLGRADTLYARFWSQTLRWLSGRGTDDQRPPLVVSTDRPDYDVGKPVNIQVSRQPKPGEDFAASEIGLEVTGPSGRPVAVSLRATSADPNLFKGSYYASAGGRYEVAAALSGGGKPIANQTTEFLVHGADLELADPGTNPGVLRALAAATGGVYVEVDDAAKLAARVPPKERRVARVQRTELWHSPGLFLGFLGFVTAEWFLRRRNHLV
ncbi:MAG: glutamine amidotransferase [Isosphaeraceae bacterium]|nr:glutamine amidotransferase [Isosphaeraceae bacterium]